MVAAGRVVTVVLFEGFEVLDVFGPVELLSKVPEVSIEFAGPRVGPVRSAQGAEVIATTSHAEVITPDVLLVPGGQGTRELVGDPRFLRWLGEAASRARLVTSVCTGSALLAAAGSLDGYRATSNKIAFDWVTTCGPSVDWVPRARWVHDRDRWTSSGVSAGMDMTHALIADLFGDEAALTAVRRAEYQPQTDSSDDPFAALLG